MLIFLPLLQLLSVLFEEPVRKIQLTVEIQNIKTATGKVQIGLFKPCDGFPDKCKPTESRLVNAEKGSIKVVFEVEPGEYALAVFHDLNNNGKIDTRFFIPREPYGFSNNIRPRFSPPKFADCQVHIRQKDKTITLRVN